MQQTKTHILGQKITLYQPEQGYRAGLDAVFLGASIHLKPSETCLDVGFGVGAAGLTAAYHNATAQITGLEILDENLKLAHENIQANNFDHVNVVQGDLTHNPLNAHSFDQVISNPPYFEAHAAAKSQVTQQATSYVENFSLSVWIDYCLKRLKHRGFLTLIYPTDRLDDVLNAFGDRVGNIKILPLWPKTGRAAKRVLIQARKDVSPKVTLLPGLKLHEEDGAYTVEADAILKGETQISFD